MKKKVPDSNASLTRRQLIRTGFIGSAILSGASATAVLSGCASKPEQYSLGHGKNSVYQFLNKQDVALVAALVPAIVGDQWPEHETEQNMALGLSLERTDRFISRMGSYNLGEVRKLFDLLNQRLMRGLTTGIWSPWEKTSNEDVATFLTDWKHSSFSLFNGAYNALTDIIGFAWYSSPANTAHLGYGGPPAYLIDSLPQFKQNLATRPEHHSAGEA